MRLVNRTKKVIYNWMEIEIGRTRYPSECEKKCLCTSHLARMLLSFL